MVKTMQTAPNGIQKGSSGPSTAGLPGRVGRVGLGAAVRVVLALAVGAFAVVVLGRWAWLLWQGVRGPGPASASELLVALAASAGAVLGAWLWLGMVASALSRLPGVGALAAPLNALAPRVARSAVAFLIGATLVGGAAATAQAAPTSSASASVAGAVRSPGVTLIHTTTDPSPSPSPSPSATPGAAPTTSGPDVSITPGAGPQAGQPSASAPADAGSSPGWRPSAPTVRPGLDPRFHAPAARQPAGTDGGAQPRQVVVVRGDTLWSIAARALGPEATPAQIAAEWPRWYAANRDVIGPNPDIIRPGEILTAPNGGGAS